MLRRVWDSTTNKEKHFPVKSKIVSLINQQINHELYSWYLYLSLSTVFERAGMFGFEKWAKTQAGEEQSHAHKMIEYLQDKREMVELTAVAAPEVTCDSVLSALKVALEHEIKVTTWINDIVAATSTERDYTSFAFLQQFVLEQIEEEKKVADLIARVTIAGDDVILVDHELLD